jgi:hypothetical protein
MSGGRTAFAALALLAAILVACSGHVTPVGPPLSPSARAAGRAERAPDAATAHAYGYVVNDAIRCSEKAPVRYEGQPRAGRWVCFGGPGAGAPLAHVPVALDPWRPCEPHPWVLSDFQN